MPSGSADTCQLSQVDCDQCISVCMVQTFRYISHRPNRVARKKQCPVYTFLMKLLCLIQYTYLTLAEVPKGFYSMLEVCFLSINVWVHCCVYEYNMKSS